MPHIRFSLCLILAPRLSCQWNVESPFSYGKIPEREKQGKQGSKISAPQNKGKEIHKYVGHPIKHIAPSTFDIDDSSEDDYEEGVFKRDIPPFFKDYNKHKFSAFNHSHFDIGFSEVAKTDEETCL
jgi:hypothetical protein